VAREALHLLQVALPYGVGRLLQATRCVPLLAPRPCRQPVQLLLQQTRLAQLLRAALDQLLQLLATARTRGALHPLRGLPLLLRQPLRALQRLARVALQPRAPLVLQPAGGITQPVQGLLALRGVAAPRLR